ncbi:hypothetical protein Hanom_Chr06g00510591 [Helianthus anomalus]
MNRLGNGSKWIVFGRPINEPNEHKQRHVHVRSFNSTEHQHKHIIKHIFFVFVRSLRKWACSCLYMFFQKPLYYWKSQLSISYMDISNSKTLCLYLYKYNDMYLLKY